LICASVVLACALIPGLKAGMLTVGIRPNVKALNKSLNAKLAVEHHAGMASSTSLAQYEIPAGIISSLKR